MLHVYDTCTAVDRVHTSLYITDLQGESCPSWSTGCQLKLNTSATAITNAEC